MDGVNATIRVEIRAPVEKRKLSVKHKPAGASRCLSGMRGGLLLASICYAIARTVVCVSVCWARCSKAVEPIEMQLLVTNVGQGSVFKEFTYPMGRGHFQEDIVSAVCQTRATVPVQHTQRTNTFVVGRSDMTKKAMRPLAKLLWTVVQICGYFVESAYVENFNICVLL